MNNQSPSHKIMKVFQQWRMGPRVEKMSLKPEVQDFCVQFPVYRLELLHNTQHSYCGVGRRGGYSCW